MANLQTSICVVVVLVSVFTLSAASSEGICSVHQGLSCDDNANCIEKNETENGFICVCNEGYHGDGLINGTGCQGKQPCLLQDDCHTYGMCEDGHCACKPGFEGDGFSDCKDVDECLPCDRGMETCMCDENAICTNNIGNFTCQCKNNYEGDGLSCTWFCAINADCHENGRCNGKECVCRNGYEGDGRFNCTDIDECAVGTDTCSDSAECTNTIGSYTCQCKNGYTGNGYTCTAIPQTCDEILKKNVGAANGDYTIDPDGTGSLDSVIVECDMKTAPGMGITIMKPTTPMEQTTKSNPDVTVTYEQTVPQIQSVIDNSNFCYQYMSAKCRWKAKMLDGDDYWVDVKNNTHYTWGGAKTSGKCVCGQIGACENPASNCNCDGSASALVDDGKIIEKDLLPIILVHIGGLTGYEKMDIALGPVTCGPKPFGFPIDCHEAKFDSRYKIEEDGPQIIDIDGPDGPSNPILVQCDMTSYPHVGITVVVHDKPNPTEPTPDGEPIIYAGNVEEINSIIQNSAFCRQDVEYDCQDSPITTNGNTQFVDINGDVKDYWPGGMNGMCACGLTKTCFNEDAMCNCDTVDGVRRKDFGPVTNKADLPIGSVRSAISGNSSMYTVGPLKCSRREFGFQVNCQSYFQNGYDYSYTYWVDPDGPKKEDVVDEDNVEPFPVHCVMVEEPPHGITVIHHSTESTTELSGGLEFKYYLVSALQLIKLRERSTYCMQSVSFTCTSTPLFEGGAASVQWYDIEGNAHSYFNGNGSSNGCACAASQSCDGGLDGLCNCDVKDGQTREDIGNLIEKLNLPIASISGTGPSVTAGPMQCFDVFPTCSDLYWFMRGKRVESEDMVSNGQYTISPGGADGVQPFKVTCKFPKTEIPITPGDNTNSTSPDGDQPITKCFDINYGNGLTKEQVQSLIDNSKSCTQELVYKCNNAPVTDRVHFKTCDGQIQEGWAGSNGDDQCGCGVTGTCASANGETNQCNCAIQDGIERTDGGWIHSKSRLPVCEVCITLDPVTDDQPSRSASYEVSPLYCSYYNIGVFGTCQDRRDSTVSGSESATVFIDPDGVTGGKDPFPIYCEIEAHPPAGVTRINPKPEDKPIPKEGGVIIVEYYVYEFELIRDVVEKAVFCEQDVYILCNGANFPTERGDYNDWEVYGNGTITCKEGGCSCDDGSVFGGFIGTGLPVTNVILDPSTSDRELHIGPLKCYDLYKDCHDIKIHNAMNGEKRGHVYAVDPDGPGGVEYFAVQCDFDTDKDIGITIIKGNPGKVVVEGQTEPGSQTTDIVYPDATPEQISVLTKQSGFCSQGIQYECKETALINNNSPSEGFYTTYGGGQSSSFGTGFQSDAEGCACVLTGTCPEGKSCHCDAKGSMVSYDYGILTDKDIMPITKLNLGGQTSPNAAATATVGDIRCGPRPFDLPKDCQEVYERGFTNSGEFMIWPKSDIQPYIVRCDMEKVPGHGVTVIGHDHEDSTPVDGKDTTTETVTYNNATKEQVEGLTEVSQFCYQPIKFDCFNTQFLGYNKFSWVGTDGQTKAYLGTGGSGGCSCSGGVDKLCGGDQTRSVLENRKCSCDAAELQWRSDAGVISAKDDLAIFSMTFVNNNLANSTGKITLGKLYCSQKEFDINECDTGFNDCHKWADCKNRPGTFECNCRPGYQGKKVPGVWANGRNCYDDNECALGLCPHSSDCENTVGSFLCKCKAGYKQVGPEECKDYDTCKTICEDIDECADPALNNCSEHAVCTNLPGSYDCRCKRGFRGDGVECTPVGICSCFGDPHCISYDTKFLTFQGDCQYIMSQDGCGLADEGCNPDEGNCAASEQTFQVLTKHWNKNLPGITGVTWVEKVTFKFLNHSVVLGQNHAVFVDGYKRNVPVNIPDMLIQKRGKWLEVLTPIGVEVYWDGFEKVEVHVPPLYQGKMCGLCGNYNSNPGDDWTIGPACAGEGMVTNNPDKFGQSYVDVSYKDSNPQCTFDCNPPLPPSKPCSGEDYSLAEYYCNRVFDVNGKFKSCLDKLQMDQVYTELYESCIYDVCKVTDNREMVMCMSAENLVKECGDNYDTVFTEWRTNDMCAPECGENMEYLTCGNLERVSTCDNRTTTLTSLSSATEECLADCYCKENMYMDGNKCVEKENCGCLYDDFYYSLAETYTEKDCSKMYTCNSDGTFSSRPLSCSENATCTLDEESGVYGCHCKEGFMGDGETCEFNPCGSNPCNENENCVVIGESYRCECQMGFQGECNNCQDIDECATRTHKCPPHSRCKNTVGSYTCDCISGYTKDNERCIDINECKIGTDTCGDGTRCFNTPGHFHCEPCSVNSPPDKCCACHGGKCEIPGEVCGSDGKTYSSEADLIIAKCETGKRIQLEYRGACQGSCGSGNVCPKWQTCNESEATGVPTCNCLPCTPEEVESEVKVCSNVLDLYINICSFKKIQCATDREDTIIENTIAPCEGKKGVDMVTEWTPWSPCSVSCGNGTMTRERNALVEFDDWLEDNYPLSQTSDCYEPPCPGSSCEALGCNVSQVCVESMTGEGFCICPNCENHGEDPVCGKLGSEPSSTFTNPCELAKEACEKGEPYEQLYDEKCGTKPLNCTKMPRLEVLRNDQGCISSQKINLGKCDGGCGAYADNCCKPTHKKEQILLACPDQTLAPMEVDIIESCECVPLPQ